MKSFDDYALILRELEIYATHAAVFLFAAVCSLSIAAFVFMKRNRRLRAELEDLLATAARLHAWSTFAGRSVRVPGEKGARKNVLRVKLYIDHSNFFQYWRTIVEGGAHVDSLDWQRLPETVMSAVASLPIAANRRPVYCGTNLYVSYNDDAYYDLLVDIKNMPIPIGPAKTRKTQRSQ